MKYLTFHGVNALLLLCVFGTFLLWVIWTPGFAVPPLDQEKATVNITDSEQPDPSPKTPTTRKPSELSSSKEIGQLGLTLN